MKSKNTDNPNFNRHLIRNALVTGAILLIPLIAMQFTEEVDWNLFDFVAMGILIFGMGLIYELIVWNVTNRRNRIIIGLVCLGVFLLIWAEVAVGVFGSPIAGS